MAGSLTRDEQCACEQTPCKCEFDPALVAEWVQAVRALERAFLRVRALTAGGGDW